MCQRASRDTKAISQCVSGSVKNVFACFCEWHLTGRNGTVVVAEKREESRKKQPVIFLDFDKRPAKVKLRLMLVCGVTLPLLTSPCT